MAMGSRVLHLISDAGIKPIERKESLKLAVDRALSYV